MALAYYQANCQGGDIIACWDRDCIRGPCQWVKDRGYFDGTSWHIPEFRQFGIDWPQILGMVYQYGTPGWIIERFIWDNGRMPSGAEVNEYCRLAGIPYYDICPDALVAFINSRPDIWAWAMDCYAGTAWCKTASMPGAKVGVFFAWWENMNPPERAQWNGNVHNFVCQRLMPSCSLCAAPSPPPPTLDCSTQGKYAWASQVGLPVCVADLFCGQFGRLPKSVDELNSWGTQANIRCADGSWNCAGCPKPPPPPPGGDRCAGVQCPSGQVCDPNTGQCRPGAGGGPAPQPAGCAADQLNIAGMCLDKTAALIGGVLVLMLLVRR
jgi:hypothetical protein